MKENEIQKKIKEKIKSIFPECLILKNDPNSIQGIPDLLILFKEKWAMLEVKKDVKSKRRPNQDYYVKRLNYMGGFAAFISPENEEEVLNELRHYLES